jgi:hypothetical protein
MRSTIIALGATAAIVAGCSAVSAEPASYAAQRATAVNDDGIRLELAVDRHVFTEQQPLAVTTTVTYLGPRESIEVDGAGGQLVLHTIREVIGDRDQEVTFNLDCSSFELRRDEPMEIPLQLSGSWSTAGDDAEFWRGLFADPWPALPTGTWMIDAVARYYPVANCGGPERILAASVVVDVH